MDYCHPITLQSTYLISICSVASYFVIDHAHSVSKDTVKKLEKQSKIVPASIISSILGPLYALGDMKGD